jgi:hypothetical protein
MLLSILAAVILGCDLLALAALLRARRAVRIRERTAKCRPTLVMAATGALPGYDALLACLAAQTCRPKRLIIAVESTADPAYARISGHVPVGPLPFRIELVVAGLATGQAQKARNLVAAVGRLAPDDDLVVFLDADVRPQRWWLATLVHAVRVGNADAVSGYRWQTEPSDFGGALLAAVDRSLATVPFREAGSIVWGGSIAIRREVLDRLDLPKLLQGTISDDLAMGRALFEGGWRVEHRSAVLLPSPMGSVAGIRRNFLVRQYRIMMVHRPGLVALSGLWLAARLGAWAGLLALAPTAPAALLPLAADVAASLAKAGLRDRLGAAVEAPDGPTARRGQFLVAVLPPLADLYHATGLVVALTSRRLRWSHVDYELVSRTETRVLSRHGFAVPVPQPTAAADPLAGGIPSA